MNSAKSASVLLVGSVFLGIFTCHAACRTNSMCDAHAGNCLRVLLYSYCCGTGISLKLDESMESSGGFTTPRT